MRVGLVHHIIIIPAALFLPLLRGAAGGLSFFLDFNGFYYWKQ